MSLQIGYAAPDFEAEITEGPIRFTSGSVVRAVLFSHPKDYTSGVHDRARLHGEDQARVNRRGVKGISLSVGPVDKDSG